MLSLFLNSVLTIVIIKKVNRYSKQMRTTKELGDKGEQLAIDFLLQKNYEMVSKNYRYKRAEIDLIVRKGNCIIFVEVKYRTGVGFGFPEEVIKGSKKKLIQIAAENYVIENDWNQSIRFDIISIIEKGNHLQIEHFEDAF